MTIPAYVTGYRFRFRLQDAPSDYIPCLIGVDPKAPGNPTLAAYFETSTAAYDMREIGDIMASKWTVEGSAGGNPILQCRQGKATFYIAALDLAEEARRDGLTELLDRVVNLTNYTIGRTTGSTAKV